MPKPKSPATLAKEAKIKAAIATLKAQMKPETELALMPTLSITKLKDPHPDILLRKGKLAWQRTAYLQYLLDGMKSYVPYWQHDYFLTGSGVDRNIAGKDLKWHSKNVSYTYTQYIYGYARKINCEPGMNPLAYVTSRILADDAVAMTFPDELGNVKLYIHKQSRWGLEIQQKKKMGMGGVHVQQGDGLIRANLPGLEDWKVLARYIEQNVGGYKPRLTRAAVCDIVKAIAATETQKELEHMNSSAGNNV